MEATATMGDGMDTCQGCRVLMLDFRLEGGRCGKCRGEQAFEVPEVNLPAFEEALAKLAKRAAKIGTATIGYRIGEGRYGKKRYDWARQREVVRIYRDVWVWGDRPRYEGWTFVGKLDFTAAAAGALRMMVPGEECPEKFYDIEATHCDHCHTRRQRNEVFIVRHDDGRELAVGRRCLADFLGHKAPEQLARGAELLAKLRIAAAEAEEFAGGGGPAYYDANEVLEAATMLTRKFGFRRTCEEHCTKDAVIGLLEPQKELRLERARQELLAEITEADRAKTQEIMAWVMAQDAANDFITNLQTALAGPIGYKAMGIAVAAPAAYDRAMGREVERRRRDERKAATEHVGEVKQRITVDGEVAMVRVIDGDWGDRTILKIVDDDGNVFVWFAAKLVELDAGAKVRIKGTVKEHGTYRGEKQTVLTRCKILE